MDYSLPQSVDEALSILNSESNATVFAGATDLIPQLRGGRPEPGLIVDLKKIPSLVNLSFSNGTWSIGAATPVVRIKNNVKLTKEFPGLSEASGLIGSDQIQTRASLGGNLCTASPGADTVPSLIVNDALVVIASNKGSRTIPVSDVVTGPGSISLGVGEFIIEFILQQSTPRTSDAYERFIPRTEMDIAVVDAAARISLDERGNCKEAKIAIGAAAPTVIRVPAAERILQGKKINDELLAGVMKEASKACNPINDKRGTIEYRRQVAGVLAKRVVLMAEKRALDKKENK
jgi:carbon-monoxide dehydrogenase medium subunit|tara:strand:- start:41 stop:910 length:870 start_codon:yes stop_codon:yes gene_type:complete